MIFERLKRLAPAALAAAVAIAAIPGLHAASLVLTPQGIADGFALTTFATTDPGNTGFGPFGLAVATNGTVFVESVSQNNISTFNDVDGRVQADATHTRTPGFGSVGATAVGNTFWGAAPGNGNFGGTFTTYSSDLATITTQTVTNAVGTAYHPYLGMATTPDNHVIATTDSGTIIEITPGTTIARVIVSGVFGDGVSVSPDGTQIVVENGGSVQVYNRTTGVLVHSYGLSNSPDGTGVIYGGALNGDIVVNGNNGTVQLIDTLGIVTTIATGGTRGDYTAPDSTNGTLLLDYSDKIYRLSCAGCSIGSPAPSTPEPGTFLLLGAGLATAYLGRRRLLKS